MSLKFHTLRIASVQPLTADSSKITFQVPDSLKGDYRYLSGQYITLKANIDGVEVRRSYSLCSSPFEDEWSVGIKRVSNGVFSNYALDHLAAGDEIEAMTPAGTFLYESNPTQKKTIVLYAAGSGITPVLSIAKTVLRDEPNSEVCMFFGNKGFSSVMFSEALESLKNKYISRFRLYHIFSQESQGIPVQKGRMDSEKLEALHKHFLRNDKVDDVYVCGPEAMIHAVRNFYLSKGLKAEQIHFELFHANVKASENKTVKIEPQSSCEIDLIIDDDRISFTMTPEDDSILSAAQRAGADVPYACLGGVCCTCKARILSGEAEMKVNYSLEKDEITAGYILTCQAVPTSEKIVVSFDD
jgi:ring-1,2-phenylacetyl-CoA epoxidase subunit PaaE